MNYCTPTLNVISLFFLWIGYGNLVAQNLAPISTIDAQESTSIEFGFQYHNIQLTQGENNEIIAIELEIHSNMDESIMLQLLKSGRYNIAPHFDNNILTLHTPNIYKSVNVQGTFLEETINIHIIAAPCFIISNEQKRTSLQKDITTAMQAMGAQVKGIPTEQEANFMKIRDKIEIRTIRFVQKANTSSNLMIGVNVEINDIIIDGKPLSFN